MAGTRRQSRVRATTDKHQHQRPVSQVASIVPETAIATESKVIEIAESVHGASPRQATSPCPETPIDRSTTALCRRCNSKVGEFYNSWHKVTSSFYSPTLLGSYKSLLRKRGQRKAASDQTELKGCTIDLTHCPACDDCLGFVVVDAPTVAERFRDRDFFKLHRIELRCNIIPSKTIIVEPLEDTAPDLVAFDASISPSPRPSNTATETMDLDTPLSSSHPLWAQPTQRALQHHQYHRMGSREILNQPLPLNGAQLPALSRSPPNKGNATPATAPATVQPPTSPQTAQPRSASVVGSSTKEVRLDSVANSHHNEYSYPRAPREVYFDAIERLQTQTAQNTSALAAQARSQTEYAETVRQIEGNLRHEFQSQLHRQDQDLRRMDESVNRLLQELQDCRRTIVTLAHEVNATRAESARRPSEIAQPGYQDEALELMAQRIGEVSHRTTDLETLRDHMAIIGGRVQRLESESAATHNPHRRPTLPTYQSSHNTHAAPHPDHVASFQTPARPKSNPQPAQHYEKPAVAVPQESGQRHEPAPSQNGWATVNAGMKRVFDNDTKSPRQGIGSAPASPKRPRLVTEESQDTHSTPQIHVESSHILPSQTQPVVASQPQPQPGLHSGPHPGLPSQAYISYGTQDSPSDSNWRSESQRSLDSRPARGRGSRGGRGPGSRGGRMRRSMQEQQGPTGSPGWERDSWTAVSDSQASPVGFEDSPAYSARGVVRRGGGGIGMRGGSSLMERSHDWTPEIGPRSVFHDPPSETKKTRSKPVRNEEGILVRKDGRPDRRSQSSAANLRKVHARKEEQQREGEAGSTPNGHRYSMSAVPDTPSPKTRSYPEPDVTNSVRKKHNDILGKIFPDGIDSSRKQHDYAHQVFNEDRDHTAHPRSHSTRTTRGAPQIKTEQVERSEVAETQTPTNGDVDMNEAGSMTNRVGAPTGNSERESRDQATPEQDGGVQILEIQPTQGSAPIVARSEVAI